jgi:hypothetical protein
MSIASEMTGWGFRHRATVKTATFSIHIQPSAITVDGNIRKVDVDTIVLPLARERNLVMEDHAVAAALGLAYCFCSPTWSKNQRKRLGITGTDGRVRFAGARRYAQ